MRVEDEHGNIVAQFRSNDDRRSLPLTPVSRLVGHEEKLPITLVRFTGMLPPDITNLFVTRMIWQLHLLVAKQPWQLATLRHSR
jgi:hypothetical protein